MAGFYPDVPGPRMAFDRDGSVGFYTASGVTTSLSSGDLVTLNDESDGYLSTPNAGAVYGIIFPELRDLNGYFLDWHQLDDLWSETVETSADTTNGVDGTWTTRSGPSFSGGSVSPYYRSAITTLSVSGINAIRFTFTQATGPSHASRLYALHLFGSIASGQNPDRLRLWQPVTDAEIGAAFFDWADVAQSTTEDRTFRVKNNSSTLTAHTIVLDVEALTDTTPSVADSFELSDDGVTFGTTVTITSLAPGAISSILTVQRTTPSNAVLSVWAARITAVAGTWT